MRTRLTLTVLALALLALAVTAAVDPSAAPVDATVEPLGLLERAENFELIGHDPLNNRGMNAALTVHGDYAYVGSRTDGKPGNDNLTGAGVLVVNVSDPAAPQVVHEIGPPDQGLQDQTSRELRIWPAQELLIVMNLDSNCSELIHACSPVGGQPDEFSFYDISGDNAAAPVKVASYDPSSNPHEFFLWQDPADPARALFFISATSSNRLLITDISGARDGEFVELASWPIPVPGGDLHSMTPTTDGKTVHLAYLTGGYYLADTSSIVEGHGGQPTLLTPAGQGPSWPGPGAHSAVPVPGRDWSLVTDEVYGEALRALGHGCPWGWTRMIDTSNPVSPQVVAEYRLAENEASFCATDVPRPSSSYSAHNPTITDELAFITWHSGGLQAIDISDPTNPTQAGYYYPDPLAYVVTEDPALSAGQDKVVMWSFPVIQDGLIYVVDVRNGLYILHYTGDGSDVIDSLDFLEGNSNLGDALRFAPVESP
ncbi:MAG: hypothetical protein KY469_05100 [Actinobacteria bacterium]|nr:hypothetical protein [Actinomycetota bacterium]